MYLWERVLLLVLGVCKQCLWESIVQAVIFNLRILHRIIEIISLCFAFWDSCFQLLGITYEVHHNYTSRILDKFDVPNIAFLFRAYLTWKMTRFSLACLFCMNESLFACLTLFINLQQKTDRVSYLHQAKLIEKNPLYVYFFGRWIVS